MKDETRPPTKAGWPVGLIGMLALIVGTELYISRRATDLGTMYSIEWRTTGQSVKRQAKTANICCFGTSLTRMGVAPKILEEKLGKSVYNFALSGGQPFASYTMLRHVLDAGGKPEAVVVDFKWSAIAVDHKWNERVLPEMATLRECLEFAWTAHDPEFMGRLAMVSLFPSYRCRAEIQQNILAAIKGVEPKRNHEHSIMGRNARINRGAIHIPNYHVFKGEVNPGDPHLFPQEWACHPMSELYIHRFLELAAKNNIAVFWLIPPVPGPTQERRNEIGAEARYTAFVKTVIEKHPQVTVVDARFSNFALEAFHDTTHLNRDGAVALSTALAASMAAKQLSPPTDAAQWVSLPAYRPIPDASKIEDMGESLAFIAQENLKKARR